MAVDALFSTREETPRASRPGVLLISQWPCHRPEASQVAAEVMLWTGAPRTPRRQNAQRPAEISLRFSSCSGAPRLPQRLGRPRLEAPSSSVCCFCRGPARPVTETIPLPALSSCRAQSPLALGLERRPECCPPTNPVSPSAVATRVGLPRMLLGGGAVRLCSGLARAAVGTLLMTRDTSE